MGRVVSLSPTALRTSLFGDNSAYMGNYLQYQMQNVANVMGTVGNRIYDTLASGYNYITDELRRYGIRNELEKEGMTELDNNFSELLTFEDLQGANLTMQRWVMAEPTLKSIYLDRNCDGYGGSYVNISGNTYGEDDYDYRKVMNGIINIDEDGNESCYTYIDDLLPGDRELDFYEQGQIIQTWQAIRHVMATSQRDFTKESEEPQFMNI